MGDGGGEGWYTGGGTNEAFLGLAEPIPPLALDPLGPPPESNAACKADAYLSWKLLLWLISIATPRKSAEIAVVVISMGWHMGSRPHMARATSCWYSGASSWMRGTFFAQTLRKETNAGGQFSYESSVGC